MPAIPEKPPLIFVINSAIMNHLYFTYRNHIMKTTLILFLTLIGAVCLHAQRVTGRVTVAGSDSILAGVSIRVKGANNGTVTGNDGTYSVNAAGNAVLVFSIVGFTDREVAVNNRSTVNISLASSTESLQQV